MNRNTYKPIEAEKQNMERSIYHALKKYNAKDVLFEMVLPLLYEQMKKKVETAILKEGRGRLHLMRGVLGENLEKKLRHYMGKSLVFGSYSDSKQSILEYLESALFEPRLRESIRRSVVREKDGFVYVDESKILPHHIQLLKNILGDHVVFQRKAQEAVRKII